MRQFRIATHTLKTILQNTFMKTTSCGARRQFSARMTKNDFVDTKGIFIQSLNPMTGHFDWKMVPEDYDYQQEVARAAFADMLHDTERNHLYYVGLEAAIRQKRSEGSEVHVLDIGTGTGLLAMMAAKIGADSVTAIEEFQPMANCAEKIIELNGFKDQIKLIRKRSTEVRIGKEMARKANILVTEVFDTELIGEGAISTFYLAHKHLLTDDCLVVPCEGTLYAQVVESDLISRWNELKDINLAGNKDEKIKFKSASNSSTSLALHDLQLSQVKMDWFKSITDPIEIFRFNFGAQKDGKSIPVSEQSSVEAKALRSGRCQAIFMWWDIKMDPQKSVILSCAPKWAHPTPDRLAWRDHWMQAVYYPINTPEVVKDETLTVISNHDEYSFWFDVAHGKVDPTEKISMPKPIHGIHLAVSRPRLGQINDQQRNSTIYKGLSKIIKEFVLQKKKAPNVLFLSELSVIPIMTAAAITSHLKDIGIDTAQSSGKIHVCETNHQMRQVLSDAVIQNQDLVQDRICFLDNIEMVELEPEKFHDKIDIIIGEPHFSINFLPWHNLLFWFSAQKFIQTNPELILMPKKAELWMAPVHYQDLWKIRAPVGNVEGFKMEHFDNIIMSACDLSDACVEPHPLWEYPCKALGQSTKLMTFDLSEKLPKDAISVEKIAEIETEDLKLNGIALWVEWQLTDDPDLIISGGPVEPIQIGQTIEWDVHSKQGVHFFQKPSLAKSVTCTVVFKPREGDFEFKFERQLLSKK